MEIVDPKIQIYSPAGRSKFAQDYSYMYEELALVAQYLRKTEYEENANRIGYSYSYSHS